MIEYRVEVTDSKGQSAKILLRLTGSAGQDWWLALDKGFFAYPGGVVNTGYYPTKPLAWVAMYGGGAIDDNKLVFHLDDFLTHTHANSAGEGFIYKQDYLMAEWGKLSWRLLA